MEEWLDHPVTKDLVQQVEDRSKWLEESKGDCFVPGNPAQTQENHLTINGRLVELADLMERLTDKATFEYVEEVSGEYKRNLPDGVPGIGEAGPY